MPTLLESMIALNFTLTKEKTSNVSRVTKLHVICYVCSDEAEECVFVYKDLGRKILCYEETILCTKGQLSMFLDRSNKVMHFNDISEVSGQQNIGCCDLEVKEVRPTASFR